MGEQEICYFLLPSFSIFLTFTCLPEAWPLSLNYSPAGAHLAPGPFMTYPWLWLYVKAKALQCQPRPASP